jgi:hypothetical protein
MHGRSKTAPQAYDQAVLKDVHGSSSPRRVAVRPPRGLPMEFCGETILTVPSSKISRIAG